MTGKPSFSFLGRSEIGRLASEFWGRAPNHFSASGEWKGEFFSIGALDQILSHHSLEWPQLRLVRDGSLIDQSNYSTAIPAKSAEARPTFTLDLAAVGREIAAGATLVLDGLDKIDPSVRAIVEGLERQFECTGSANAYLTAGIGSQGFELHWDDHDVIVFQLEGEKLWSIFEPTRPHPLWNDVEAPAPPDEELAKETSITLRPDDVLYVPHGWWHKAESKQGHSLHLTIGLKRLNGTDVVDWLSSTLREHEAFRQPMPSSAPDKADWLAQIANLVSASIDHEDAATQFVTYATNKAQDRPAFSLAHSLGKSFSLEDEIRIMSGHVELTFSDEQIQSVSLVSRDSRRDFPVELAGVFKALSKGEFVRLSLWVEAGFGEDEVLALVSELYQEGLVLPKVT